MRASSSSPTSTTTAAPFAATTESSTPAWRTRRVLLVSEWHAKYVSWLGRALVQRGAGVRLLTRDHDLEFGGEAGEAEPGAMVRWVAETLGDPAMHLTLPGRVRDVTAMPHLLRIRRSLSRFRPDVVHVQDAVAQDPRLLACGLVRPRRFALTIHDVEQHPGDHVRDARTARVRKWLIHNAALIFVHSETLRAQLAATESTPAQVVVVPHGTHGPRPTPLPSEPDVLFFGRISHYKGVAVLLDAMEQVWKRLPEARLTIAGHGDLPQHPGLADPRVEVRNTYVPEAEVSSMFAAARCVALPYLEASQSGVGSRAKSFGRPLVVTDVGGLPDLVADGAGRVVPAGDPSALGIALLDVLDSVGLAERMAATALRTVAGTSWDSVAALTLDAYDRHMLGGPA